jgi:hypothetical protein
MKLRFKMQVNSNVSLIKLHYFYMSQNTEKIKKYLIENLQKLQSEGGGGTYPKLPSFDLYALD